MKTSVHCAMKKIKANRKARIGLYTVGLKAYWPQFKGLRERLVGYGQHCAKKIATLSKGNGTMKTREC